MAAASRAEGRAAWSNVELFQVAPPGCPWSAKTGMCRGRAPAPWERIKAQMANEAAVTDQLIAWEWHSCLSPYGTNPDLSTPVYKQYLAYMQAG